MAENNKKFNVVSIVILAVLGVALVMGIVGLCINWLSMSFQGTSDSIKLAEMVSDNKTYKDFAGKDLYLGIEAVQAFGIITIIAAALTAASFVVSKFVNVKALKFVTIGLAVLLIISALLTLLLTLNSTTSIYCNELKKAGAKFIPAAGCWLASIFGVLGGVAGIVGAVKG